MKQVLVLREKHEQRIIEVLAGRLNDVMTEVIRGRLKEGCWYLEFDPETFVGKLLIAVEAGDGKAQALANLRHLVGGIHRVIATVLRWCIG